MSFVSKFLPDGVERFFGLDADLVGKADQANVLQGTASGTLHTISPSPEQSSLQVALASEPLARDAYRHGLKLENLELPKHTLGELDPDRRPASISVALSGSVSEEVLSAYSRFFLQAVTEGQTEKFQVVETFTAHYAFFYGKKPSVYNFRGTLLNDEYHRWADDFTFFYENYFRGTKAVERGAHAVLSYDGKLVRGFITDFAIQQIAEMDRGVGFSMNLLVTDHERIKTSPDIQTLIDKSVQELRALKDKAAQQAAATTKNLPSSIIRVAKEQATAKRGPTSLKTENEKKSGDPSSVKADANTVARNIQRAFDTIG